MLKKKYIPRGLEKTFYSFLERREAIAIVGPRQSGKTTFLEKLEKKITKKQRVKFITFENKSDLNLFQKNINDFKKIAEQYDVLIIDEFQYAEEGGQKMKYLFDTTKTKFIVSGSSSLELTFQTGKYMVGRILDFSLNPFSFREFLSIKNKEIFKLIDRKEFLNPIEFKMENGFGEEINKRLSSLINEYLLYGGYPAVVLSKTEIEKQKVLGSIEEKYILKDIKSLLNLTTEDELQRLEKFLAGQIGGMINFEELCNVSGLSYKEVKKHLQILEKTYIISLCKPFFTNRRTELVKNPKVYFVDLGIRNYSLVDFRKPDERNDLGLMAENHVYNTLKNLYPQTPIKYWRTKSKAEVDFVIEKNQNIFPVEVKYVSKKTIGKSFYSFIEKFNPPVGIILTKDFLGEDKIKNTKVKFIPLSYF